MSVNAHSKWQMTNPKSHVKDFLLYEMSKDEQDYFFLWHNSSVNKYMSNINQKKPSVSVTLA